MSYGPIRKLNLTGKNDDFEKLARAPFLARIELIELTSKNVLDSGGMALASSAFFDRLKEIRFGVYNKGISDDSFRELYRRFGDRLKMHGPEEEID